MTTNLYTRLRRLLPDPPLQVGAVISLADGIVTIELPGGARVQARGAGTVGAKVFFRNGVIEGDAPNLDIVTAEI